MIDDPGITTRRAAWPKDRHIKRGEPTPIWHSRLYQRRRIQQIAARLARERLRRVNDGTLLREKRALADHLLTLCARAERALHRRGGDIGDDLERVDDLGFLVSLLDAQMEPGTAFERLEELGNYLEGMVLAIEVARVAGELDARRRPGHAGEHENASGPAGPRDERVAAHREHKAVLRGRGPRVKRSGDDAPLPPSPV